MGRRAKEAEEKARKEAEEKARKEDNTVAGQIDVSKAMPPVSLPPALAAKYEILCQLGEGTQGKVYKARDRNSGDEVATKQP